MQIGDEYSFTPQSSDPDGDKLTFEIRNLPTWATFNTASGELSGRPTSQHEGTYEDIVIVASDGQLSAETKPFSITATMSALGSVTLSWYPPTHYDDGTPLTGLAGFNIYYGRSRNNYPFSINIESPGISTYVIENLAPNRYYFVATAFDSMGRESAFSAEVSATVQ